MKWLKRVDVEDLMRVVLAIGVLIFGVLALVHARLGHSEQFGGAQRRDCGEVARAFLSQIKKPVQPAKVWTTVPLALPGWYQDGNLFVRPDKAEDCGVWVHEYVHHWQYEQFGPAYSGEEWYRRELEASRLEMIWRGQTQM